MAKPVFIAAVACTLLGAALVPVGIALYEIPERYDAAVNVLSAATAFLTLFSPLLWVAHYAMTHMSVEEAEEIMNTPPPAEFIPAAKVPKMRFNFKEETVREAFGKIAERYKMDIRIDVQNYEIFPFGYDHTPKKGYDIKLYCKRCLCFSVDIIQDGITFIAYGVRTKAIFLFLDDFARTNNIEIHNSEAFVNEMIFNDFSDGEIFDIIEKMIYVLFNVTDMTVEKTESSLYRRYYTPYGYTFYLDAPDYYGYTETTEIGNFKFILNKENGGNPNV